MSSSPETKNPIAAVAQMRSTSDKVRNLMDVAVCARMARSEGASMLFLPECFGFIGESAAETFGAAEDPACLSPMSADRSGGDPDPPPRKNEKELTELLTSIVRGSDDDDDGGGGTTTDPGNPNPPSPPVVPVVHSLMDGLRTIARESGLWISGGGMHVAGAPPPDDENDSDSSSSTPGGRQQRVYNTHVILDSNGSLVARYRKIHLFDVSIPGKVELKESRTTAPGTELVVCDSPVGRLGVTVCYDLRFPEVYTTLTSATMGARVLLVPSAFTVPTGAAHWHALLRGT